jgi:hypothetical protein
MVALNYQTSSTPMWINEAKFKENGNCGYILKPEWMLDPSVNFTLKSPSSTPGSHVSNLVVEVMA